MLWMEPFDRASSRVHEGGGGLRVGGKGRKHGHGVSSSMTRIWTDCAENTEGWGIRLSYLGLLNFLPSSESNQQLETLSTV